MKQAEPKLNSKIVLGVAAHPDDLDFAAGGTVARLAQAGAKVYYLILTGGSKGTDDPSLTPVELTSSRQTEQTAAAKALGVTQVFFLDYEDAALEVTMPLKRDIVRYIRQLKPDTIITSDPSVLYDATLGMINHPDHRAAGQATLDAVYPLARDHLAFPELAAEGLEPHKVKTVLLSNFSDFTYCVDITETMDAKLQALRAHTSQNLGAMQSSLDHITQTAGRAIDRDCGEPFVRIDLAL